MKAIGRAKNPSSAKMKTRRRGNEKRQHNVGVSWRLALNHRMAGINRR